MPSASYPSRTLNRRVLSPSEKRIFFRFITSLNVLCLTLTTCALLPILVTCEREPLATLILILGMSTGCRSVTSPSKPVQCPVAPLSTVMPPAFIISVVTSLASCTS